MQGPRGVCLRPGASLEQALAAHFSREVIYGAACSRCSLRATVLHAPDTPRSTAVQQLHSLLRTCCPLPECNLECSADAAGLAWKQNSAPLLKRACIARPPEVGHLLIQEPCLEGLFCKL